MGRKRKDAPVLMTGKQLKKLRTDHFRIPQTEMCDLLGVGIRAYSAYETGETSIPDPVAKLVRCLKDNLK